jgi:hypothetical protein
MLQKIRFVFFFWQKSPKTIVIGIIVQDDMNSNKPVSIHMTFYVNPSWACTQFRNNKQHVGRESVNAWKKARKRTLTDSERKRNRSAVSSKWNKCRIYVGDQLERWNELNEVLCVQTHAEVGKILLDR